MAKTSLDYGSSGANIRGRERGQGPGRGTERLVARRGLEVGGAVAAFAPTLNPEEETLVPVWLKAQPVIGLFAGE